MQKTSGEYMIRDYCNVGISPALLYFNMWESDEEHLKGLEKALELDDYNVLEMFLPNDSVIRREEIRMIRDSGKIVTYNFPVEIQKIGEYNICSYDKADRARGVEFLKRHLDYAASVGSVRALMTSGPDTDPSNRDEIKKLLSDTLSKVAPYARERNICLAIEPTERNRFKKQLLGPVDECISFINDFEKDTGFDNVRLMADTAHFPLMEEDTISSLDKICKSTELFYMHVGNAVLKENNIFYGHTHPPVGIQDGLVDVSELVTLLEKLFEVGYLTRQKGFDKPVISYEMRSYEGVSEEISARFAFEKLDSAFRLALEN